MPAYKGTKVLGSERNIGPFPENKYDREIRLVDGVTQTIYTPKEKPKPKPKPKSGTTKMAKGGSVSKRADGCAVKGKTRGKMV